jgi:hypothetical protein
MVSVLSISQHHFKEVCKITHLASEHLFISLNYRLPTLVH